MNDSFLRDSTGWFCKGVSLDFQSAYLLGGHARPLHAALNVNQKLALDNDVVDILQKSSSDGARVAGVGMQGLDNLLNSDRSVPGPPGVKVGRGADKGVT